MLQGPPQALAYQVDRLAPGIYGAFFSALGWAHAGINVTPTSYWRSYQDNERVGGVSHSQHLLGLAFDLVYRNLSDKSAAVNRMRQAGLTVIDEGDHIHTQAWSADNANRAFAALGGFA